MEALAAFVSAYEAEQGEISPAEMEQAARRARSRAVTVRGQVRKPRRRRKVA